MLTSTARGVYLELCVALSYWVLEFSHITVRVHLTALCVSSWSVALHSTWLESNAVIRAMKWWVIATHIASFDKVLEFSVFFTVHLGKKFADSHIFRVNNTESGQAAYPWNKPIQSVVLILSSHNIACLSKKPCHMTHTLSHCRLCKNSLNYRAISLAVHWAQFRIKCSCQLSNTSINGVIMIS